MFIIIGVVGFYFVIIELTRLFFYSLMKKCSNVKQALLLRRLLFICRWSITFLYWGGILLIEANDLFRNGGYSFDIKTKGLVIAIIMALQYWKQNKLEHPKGKIEHIFRISYASKRAAIKTPGGFVLFLRGFEHDDYTDAYYLKNQGSFEHFSEYHFVKAMSGYFKTFAVGMTKELEQPSGAKRVYLDDSSWREDVKEMMEKSRTIIILMNDRDSCVWEIEQSESVLEKTYFFVESAEKYNHIKERVQTVIPFPTIDESKLPLVIHFTENDVYIQPYRNTYAEYKDIALKIAMESYHLSDSDVEDSVRQSKSAFQRKRLSFVELLAYIKWNHFVLFVILIMYSGRYPFSVPVIPVHFLGVKTDYLLRS